MPHLIKLDKSTDIKWNVIKDEYGKIIPDSISLSFKDEESGSIDYSLNIDECEITVEKKSY